MESFRWVWRCVCEEVASVQRESAPPGRESNDGFPASPIAFVGIGQDYEDLMPFDAAWVVERIFAA